jgi:FKBP-type peptidyl-prolyl cis-trans isomerase SlyD
MKRQRMKINAKFCGFLTEVTIPPSKAYGPYKQELLETYSIDQLDVDEESHVGELVTAPSQQKETHITGIVKAIDGDEVTVDFNHQLAGKKLYFKRKVFDIVAKLL